MPYTADTFDEEEEARKNSLYADLVGEGALPSAIDEDALLADYAQPQPPSAAPPPIEGMEAATSYGDALEGRRRDAMSEYLSAATTPQPQSTGAKVGEFLGDNAVGLLGSFIDLAANKGRNIPQIMTANAAAAEQSRQARGAAEDRAMDFQLRAQNQRAQLAKGADAAERDAQYKAALQKHWLAQEANTRAGIDIRERRQAIADRKFKLENDPNDPAVVEWKQRLYKSGVPEGSLDQATMAVLRTDPQFRGEVELFFKEKGIPLEAQRAAATAGAGAQAKLNVETALPNVTAQAAAEGAVAEARGAGTERGKLSVDKIDVGRLAEANPILTFGDPVLAQQAANKLGYRFTDALSGANRSAHIIQGFYNLKKEFDSLPARVKSGEMTFGQAANRAAALKTAWEGHTDELSGVMSKISGAGGVAPREDVKHMVPWIENPFADDKVAGLWDSVAENIKGNLGTFAITATPPQFLSELNQGPAFKGGGHGTHAPAAKPKPAAAPAGGATKRVRRKSDGIVKALPAAQADRYLADPGYEQVP